VCVCVHMCIFVCVIVRLAVCMHMSVHPCICMDANAARLALSVCTI